jgi:hypothetical protein
MLYLWPDEIEIVSSRLSALRADGRLSKEEITGSVFPSAITSFKRNLNAIAMGYHL